MKAVITLDLEIDGEYLPEDRDALIEQIDDHMSVCCAFDIDSDRLVLFTRSWDIKVIEDAILS